MSKDKSKRRKKIVQIQEAVSKPEDQLLGSGAYLFERKFNLLDKELKNHIKDNETSKKILILNFAERYEKKGYPAREICKRISDVLSGKEYNTSARYVRRILPEKYKNLDQMTIAIKDPQEGGTKARLIKQAQEKDDDEITENDLQYIPSRRTKQIFKHYRNKTSYLEPEIKRLVEENKLINEENAELKGRAQQLDTILEFAAKHSTTEIGEYVKNLIENKNRMEA